MKLLKNGIDKIKKEGVKIITFSLLLSVMLICTLALNNEEKVDAATTYSASGDTLTITSGGSSNTYNITSDSPTTYSMYGTDAYVFTDKAASSKKVVWFKGTVTSGTENSPFIDWIDLNVLSPIETADTHYQVYFDVDLNELTDASKMFSFFVKMDAFAFGDNFRMTNVTNIKSFFNSCSSLTLIDLGEHFDTSKVVDASYMFSSCGNASIDFSKLNLSNCKRFDSMFGSSEFTSIDLSSWNIKGATCTKHMFSFCSNLVSVKMGTWKLVDDPDVDEDEPFSQMFYNCTNLVDVDVLDMDVSEVKSFYSMFDDCQSIVKLDLHTWETPNAESFNSTFYGCSSLKELDISNFTINKTTYCGSMFFCYDLNCIKVPKFVELSDDSCDWPELDANFYFYNIDGLKATQKMVDNHISSTLLYGRNSSDDFNYMVSNSYKFTRYIDENGTIYTDEDLVTYNDGENNVSAKWNISDSSSTGDNDLYAYVFKEKDADGHYINSGNDYILVFEGTDTDITKFSYICDYGSNFLGEGSIQVTDATWKISEWKTHEVVPWTWFPGRDNIKKAVIDKNCNPDSYDFLFAYLKNLTDVKFLTNGDEDKKTPTSMIKTFFLTKIGLNETNNEWVFPSEVDTSNVTDFTNAFLSCTSVKVFDVQNIDTSSATSLKGMFDNCPNVTRYTNIYGWDVSKVEDFSEMFNSNVALTNVNVSRWNVSSGVNFSKMFYHCESITNSYGDIDINNWNLANAKDFSMMFSYCFNLKYMIANDLVAPKGETFAEMFCACTGLEKLQIPKLVTSSATDLHDMLSGCQKVTCLDLTKWDVSNVTNFTYLFSGCWLLRSIDVSTWDVKKGNDFSSMFRQCKALEELNLSSFETNTLTDSMFKNCEKLKYLDISNMNLNNTSSMFTGCDALECIMVPKTLTGSSPQFGSGVTLNYFNYDEDTNTYTPLMVGGYESSSSLSSKEAEVTDTLGQATALKLNCMKKADFTYKLYETNDGVVYTTLDLVTYDDETNTNIPARWNISESGGNLYATVYWYKENSNDNSHSNGYTVVFTGDATDQMEFDWFYFETNRFFSDVDNNSETKPDFKKSEWKQNRVIPWTYLLDRSRIQYAIVASGCDLHTFENYFAWCSYLYDVKFETLGDEKKHISNWRNAFEICSFHEIDFTNISKETRATDIYYMFNECDDLEKIINIENINVEEITDFKQVFMDCDNLYDFDIDDWNVSKGTDFTNMFYRSLSNWDYKVNLDLSKWDVSSGLIFSSMFNSCDSLESVNISTWNAPNATDLSYMFYDDESLKGIDLSNWQTDNVTTYESMFEGCDEIEEILIPQFNFKQDANVSDMFYDTDELKTIMIPENIPTSAINLENDFNLYYKQGDSLTPLKYSNDGGSTYKQTSNKLLGRDASVLKLDGTSFGSNPNYLLIPVIYTDEFGNKYYDEDKVKSWNISDPSSTGAKDLYAYIFNRKDADGNLLAENEQVLVFTGTDPDIKTYTYENRTEWRQMSGRNITKAVILKGCNPDSYAYMFSNLPELKELVIECTAGEKKSVTNLNSAFLNAGLTSIDFTNFDYNTSLVTDMTDTFSSCENLEEIKGLSNLNLTTCNKYAGVFCYVPLLLELDLSSFEIPNGSNVGYFFDASNQIRKIYLPKSMGDEVNISFPDATVNYVLCNNGVKGEIQDKFTARTNVGDYIEIAPIYVDSFGNEYTKDDYVTYDDDEDQTTPEVIAKWDISEGNTGDVWANVFQKKDNTGTVVDNEYILVFTGEGEDSIDFVAVYDVNPLDPQQNFYNNNRNSWLYAKSTWKDNKITPWSWLIDKTKIKEAVIMPECKFNEYQFLFAALPNLEKASLEGSSGNVTNMSNLFNNCTSLREVNFGTNWNTSSVEHFVFTFKGCTSLVDLDLSSFDFTATKGLSGMFMLCKNLENVCITNLDKASSLESINLMFGDCEKLKHIYTSKDEYDAKSDNCNSLNFNLSSTESCANAFMFCKSLEKLDFNGCTNDSGNNYYAYMFYGCENLKELDLSKLKMTWYEDEPNFSNYFRELALQNYKLLIENPSLTEEFYAPSEIIPFYNYYLAKAYSEKLISEQRTINDEPISFWDTLLYGCNKLEKIVVPQAVLADSEKQFTLQNDFNMFEDATSTAKLKLDGNEKTTKLLGQNINAKDSQGADKPVKVLKKVQTGGGGSGSGGGGSSGGGGGGAAAPVEPKPDDPITLDNVIMHNAFINGYEDKTFKPNNSMTRAEFAKIMACISEDFKLEDYEDASLVIKPFSDIRDNYWYTPYIAFVIDKEIMNGYPEGDFKPEGLITRAEVSKVLGDIYNIPDIGIENTFLSELREDWFKNQADELIRGGIIKGYDDGTFGPKRNITRAEFVALINRVNRFTPDREISKETKEEFNKKFSDVKEKDWFYLDVLEASISHKGADHHQKIFDEEEKLLNEKIEEAKKNKKK